MRLTIILLILFLGMSSFAQNIIKKADSKYRNRKYEEASELYHRAYLENPNNYKILKGLVLCNRQLEKTKEAEKWMRIIFEQNKYSASDIYLLFEFLKANGNLEEAEKWLFEYEKLNPYDYRVKEGKEYFRKLRELQSKSLFEIEALSINTSGSEIGAFRYDNGLLFSSSGYGKKAPKKGDFADLDIYYVSNNEGAGFGEVKQFAPKLNTAENDGPVSYDATNNLLYLTQHAPKKAEFEEGELFYHMQIAIASQKKGDWSFEKDFFFNSGNYTVAQPSVSSDGKLIFFTSDINGGYGGSDIYFCYKKDNQWSEPYNLGPDVNSEGNEFFPFIAADNLLYFSSDGHQGIGGYDIFVAKPENGIFKNIENMGYGVNSTVDDISVFVDPSGMTGYVSSNRAGGKGLFDIYYFENKLIPIEISGLIKDKELQIPISEIIVEISDGSGNLIASTQTDKNGSFLIKTSKADTMIFIAKSDAYNIIQKELDIENLNKGDELVLEVFMNKK